MSWAKHVACIGNLNQEVCRQCAMDLKEMAVRGCGLDLAGSIQRRAVVST